MSGSVVRSVSFPAADLADVQDLAEEYGGISKLFQYLYRALLDHRAAKGVDPTKAEVAALVHEKRAAEEARAEQLARLRKEKAHERAEQARKRVAAVEAAKALQQAPPPSPVGGAASRVRAWDADLPEPVTYEDHVEHAVLYARHARKHKGATDSDLERVFRTTARAHGFSVDEFVREVMRNARGQTNLLAVTPTPPKLAREVSR